MTLDRAITIRVSDPWLSDLHALLNRLRFKKGEKARGELIRQVVAGEAEYWRLSPYISKSTKCVALVQGDGTAVYYIVQDLVLNEARVKLPCSIFFKPEKKRYYEMHAAGNAITDSVEAIRDKWLINYFAAWRGGAVGKNLIAQDADRLGITAKFVDLQVSQEKGARVAREILVASADYAQRQGEVAVAKDRVDVLIDIPTLLVDLRVVIDVGLYQGSTEVGKRAELEYEIRNREFALLTERELGGERNRIFGHSARHTEGKRHPNPAVTRAHRAVKASVKELRNRIRQICDENERGSDGEAIVENRMKKKVLDAIACPVEYLFGHFVWPLPYHNFVFCGAWTRPIGRPGRE